MATKESIKAAEKAETKKSTSKKVAKVKSATVKRAAIDYSKMDSPYREDTSQGIVFDLIKSGKIKKSDLKAKALDALKKSGKTTKNVAALIRATIGDATTRGWKFTVKGELLHISH